MTVGTPARLHQLPHAENRTQLADVKRALAYISFVRHQMTRPISPEMPEHIHTTNPRLGSEGSAKLERSLALAVE